MKISFYVLIANFVLLSLLQSQSYKFVALDDFYKTPLPIDSILVYNLNTNESTLYKTDSIFIESMTSVMGSGEQETFKLYPNPTTNVLNIELKSKLSAPIVISDMIGKVQFIGQVSQPSHISIDVSGLSTGTYNVQCGENSQMFIKTGESTSEKVRIINSNNYSLPTLLKSNKIQSEFDYRFTIYSKGFLPHYAYVNTAQGDSTITILMTPPPDGFTHRHVRVEIFFENIVEYWNSHQHNWRDESGKNIIDYKFTYYDTLVVRGNKYKVHSNYEKRVPHLYTKTDQYLEFKIDTVTKVIWGFDLKHFIHQDESPVEYAGKYEETDTRTNFNFNDTLQYQIINSGASLKQNIGQLDYTYYINKDYSYVMGNGCGGHYFYYKYKIEYPSSSYIKIEFVD